MGDFAPFDRPQYMYPSLQSLKSKPSSDATRAYMNQTRDEIAGERLQERLVQGLEVQVFREFKDDMARGWNQENMTSADAFYHYYSSFTRGYHLESNLNRLRTPVKVIWGEKDLYIKTDMGVEFARRSNTRLSILPGVGHYPHLQSPRQTIDEVRASFDKR